MTPSAPTCCQSIFDKAKFPVFALILSVVTATTAHAATCVPGDANLDGQFNTADIITVFQAGKYYYGHGTALPAVWQEGDFDGNGRFDWPDLQLALNARTTGQRVACPGADSSTENNGINPVPAHPAQPPAPSDPCEDKRGQTVNALQSLNTQVNQVLKLSDTLSAISLYTTNLENYLANSKVATSQKDQLRKLNRYSQSIKDLAGASFAGSYKSAASNGLLPVERNGNGFTNTFKDLARQLSMPLPDTEMLALISLISDNNGVNNVSTQDLKSQFPSFCPDKNTISSSLTQHANTLKDLARLQRWVKAKTLFAKKRFPVFDSATIDNKPNLVAQGSLLPMSALTHWYWFPYDEVSKQYLQTDQVHESHIRQRMRELQRKSDYTHNKLIVINIESTMGLFQRATRSTDLPALEQYRRMLSIAREELPQNPICIYRYMPARGTSEVMNWSAELTAGYHQHNKVVAEKLLPLMDLLCPSIYDIYGSSEEHISYRAYATGNLNEAKKIAAWDGVNSGIYTKKPLPVIAYVNPMVHDSSPTVAEAGRPIAAYRFQQQLSLIQSLGVDGMVLWAGRSGLTKQRVNWNTWPAREVFLDFLADNS